MLVNIVQYQMHWICAAKISLPVRVFITSVGRGKDNCVVKCCLNMSLGNSLDNSGTEQSCSILVEENMGLSVSALR